MKKITLFAVAAVAASSALAVVPNNQAMSTRSLRAQMQAEPMSASSLRIQEAGGASRAEAVPSALPTYTTTDAMYLGLSRDWMYKQNIFGLVPASADVKFTPYYEADSYAWAWTRYVRNETVDYTSTDKVLTISTLPFQQFAGPTLEIPQAGGVVSYNDSCVVYYAGGSPAMWSEYFEEFNVSPIKTPAYVLSAREPQINYTKEAAATHDPETGTSLKITGILPSAYKSGTDFKITGYGSIVPGSAAPYVLKGGYMFVNATTSAATEIEIAVLSMTEDGKINRNDTIGVGYMILPEGETAGVALDFVVNKRSEVAGLSTDEPIVVPTTGVYLSFTGVNNPDVISVFNIPYQNEYFYDYAAVSADQNSIIPDLFNWNACLEIDYKNAAGEDMWTITGNYGLYGSDESELRVCSEYAIYYDVEYPAFANATQGYESDDMTIEIANEGGQTNRYFETNKDMIQLIDDEYVVVEEENCDWLEYELLPDEDYETLFNLVVKADALPEGVEGRTATITFVGYGFDNTITITQGDPNASIEAIVANQAKQGNVYDLQGRVVKNATKGIYIVNGAKVIL